METNYLDSELIFARVPWLQKADSLIKSLMQQAESILRFRPKARWTSER